MDRPAPRLVDQALYSDILSDTAAPRDSPAKVKPSGDKSYGLSPRSSTAALNRYLTQETKDDIKRTLAGGRRVSFSSGGPSKAVEDMQFELGRAKSELAQADRY